MWQEFDSLTFAIQRPCWPEAVSCVSQGFQCVFDAWEEGLGDGLVQLRGVGTILVPAQLNLRPRTGSRQHKFDVDEPETACTFTIQAVAGLLMNLTICDPKSNRAEHCTADGTI